MTGSAKFRQHGREGNEVMSAIKPQHRTDSRSLHGWCALLFWLLFGAGLLVQALAPRLKIEGNRFILPQSLVSSAREMRPAEIVERARRMQALSAILTLSGALGLAVNYRKALFGRRSVQASLAGGSPRASTVPES